METKITVTIEEKTTAVITPEEWKMIEEKRAADARQARIKEYRQEMANLLKRMAEDKVSLRCFKDSMHYTSCSNVYEVSNFKDSVCVM